MTKTVKEITEIIKSVEACVSYVENNIPDYTEHDRDTQCKIMEHLEDYIRVLENLEVEDRGIGDRKVYKTRTIS